MKLRIVLIGILFVIASCHIDTAIDQLNEVRKPATVFSENEGNEWYESPQFTVRDADGKLIEIDRYGKRQLTKKYNVGDTIK